MAKVTFHQGIKSLYDADIYKDGLYFATDTQELLLDGQVYGANSGSMISDMLYNPDNSQATLILVKGDGSTFEVTVTAASSELAGLMTAADKNKLDNINIDNYYTRDLIDSSLDSKADKSDLDSLSNNVSSLTSTVEANESALDNLSTVVDTKQDKLTAGNGIDITNNVISTTLDTNPFIFVDSLPTSDIQEGKIYCIPDAESTEEHNVWDEYYYVDNNWELFGKYVPEVDLADYYKKSETYSQSEVNSMVSNLESHEVDIYSISGEAPLTLEGKYTEADHTLTITGSVDLSDYAKTADIPTKTSDLTNDSGYITDSALNGYAKSSDIPTAVSLLTNDSGYITESSLDGYAKESELSNYAKKTDVIESVQTVVDSPLSLDGYIDGSTLHLSGSVDTYSKNEIDSKISTATGGGITDVNVSGTSPLTLNGSVDNGVATITGSVDLSDYAKSSDLANYVTSDSLDNTLGNYVSNSELNTTLGDYAKTSDLSDYATKDDLDSKQDKLTAGTGIEISGNVISSTATGSITEVSASGTSPLTLNSTTTNGLVSITGSVDAYSKSESDEIRKEIEAEISTAAGGGITSLSANGSAPLTLEASVNDGVGTITGSVDLSSYATISSLTNYATKEEVPTKLSDLEDDKGYVTDTVLDNYYTKKETYSADLIDEKLNVALSGGLTTIEVSGDGVLTLESSVSGTTATITGKVNLSDYAKSDDLNKYLTISDASNTYQPIGNYATSSDLSNYLTTSDAASTYQLKGDYALESELKDKQDKLSAKSPISISSDNEISIDLTDYVTTELLNEAIEGLTPDPGTGTVTSVTARNDDATGILAFSGSPTIGAVTLTASIKEEGLKSYIEAFGYAKSSDIPTIPTNVSAFTNDAGYITDSALSDYAKSSDIPTKTSELTNDSGYITSIPTLSDLGGIGTINASGTSPLTLSASKSGTTVNISGSVDLSDYVLSSMLDDYALKSSVPTTTSLLTNDSGYITTSALSDYATTETLNASISTIENELNSKLDTLTAGTGIEISGNTISTSGVITNVIVNSESPLTLSRSISNAGEVTITGSVDLSDYQTALKYYSELTTGVVTIDATRALYLYGTRGITIESTSGNVEITANGIATYNGNEIATVSDLDSYATTDQLASKLDVLTAGDNITISNNVISATSSVNQTLEDLREYYKDNLTALNELCFETETWQIYCLPNENCIVDYTDSLNASGYGSALVHFGFSSRLKDSGNCLSIDGVPIPVFIDSTDGEAYTPVIIPVKNGVCQKLDTLIKVTPLPVTADDLAKKQDKLNYYTEGEESATIQVPTGEFIVNGGDIRLIASTKGGYKAYYNDKEIATVSDLENYATTSDLSDKLDKLKFYSESSSDALISGANTIEGIASDTALLQGSEVNLQSKVEVSSSSTTTNKISISDSISIDALIGDVSIKTADGYKATYNGKEIATIGTEGGDTYEDSTTNVNILKGSDFNNMSIWTYGNSIIRKESALEGLTSLYGTGGTSSIQLYVYLEPDTYYTLSWWSKSNRAFVSMYYMFNGTYDYIIDGVENTGSGNSAQNNYVVAGSGEDDWTYHTLVFLNTYTGSNTPYIEFHTSGSSTYYHEICMPKLEKGLTATQWTGGAYNKVSTSDNIGDIVLYNILEKKNIIVSTDDINAYDYPADKYVPIGIVMIPASENIYNNYKAGVISLKYMDNTNPDVGTSATNGVVMYWGYNSTQWNTAVSSTSDAQTDYKGWVKSQVIAENITSSYWKTSASVSNASSAGNYPAIGSCWRYTTAGTMPGDWYLPAAGELYKALTADNLTIFNNSVDIINDIYGSGSAVGNEYNEGLWSSSESSNTYAYIYRTTTHGLATLGKSSSSIDSGVLKTRAFIQI